MIFNQPVGRHNARSSMPVELANRVNTSILQMQRDRQHARDRLGAVLGNIVQASNFSADPIERCQSNNTLLLQSEAKNEDASNIAVANESAIQVSHIKARKATELDD